MRVYPDGMSWYSSNLITVTFAYQSGFVGKSKEIFENLFTKVKEEIKTNYYKVKAGFKLTLKFLYSDICIGIMNLDMSSITAPKTTS